MRFGLTFFLLFVFQTPFLHAQQCAIQSRDIAYANKLDAQAERTKKILSRQYQSPIYREVLNNETRNINPASLDLEYEKKTWDAKTNSFKKEWVSYPSKQNTFMEFENTEIVIGRNGYNNKELIDELSEPGPDITQGIPRRYLELSEATQLLNSAVQKCDVAFKDNHGACFLKATHIAKELSDRFPDVPVLKLWLVGNMTTKNGKSWYYHVVPIVPVRDRNGVSWMALDVLLRDSGPSHIRPWAQYWYHNASRRESDFLLKVSTANKLSPVCKEVTPEMFEFYEAEPQLPEDLQKLHKID